MPACVSLVAAPLPPGGAAKGGETAQLVGVRFPPVLLPEVQVTLQVG